MTTADEKAAIRGRGGATFGSGEKNRARGRRSFRYALVERQLNDPYDLDARVRRRAFRGRVRFKLVELDDK